MGSLDPNPDPDSRSGSMWAKIIHKNRKKFINLIFWSAGCSVLRAIGFSCSLDVVLYGGLRISKLQFFFKNRFKKNSKLYGIFFFNFLSSKPGAGLDPDLDPKSLEMLDTGESWSTTLVPSQSVVWKIKQCSIHMPAAGLLIRITWMRIRITVIRIWNGIQLFTNADPPGRVSDPYSFDTDPHPAF
jgi:hypothetical protein